MSNENILFELIFFGNDRDQVTCWMFLCCLLRCVLLGQG